MSALTQATVQLTEVIKKRTDKHKTAINKDIAELLKEYNLLMLNKGIDIRGKRIPKLTKDYKRRKSTAAGRREMMHASGDSPNDFAAKKQPNHGRLSGKTFAAVKFKVTFAAGKQSGSSSTMNIKVTGGKRHKLWEYLASNRGATRGWHKKGQKKGKLKSYSKAKRFLYGVVQKGAYRVQLDEKIKAIFIKYSKK